MFTDSVIWQLGLDKPQTVISRTTDMTTDVYLETLASEANEKKKLHMILRLSSYLVRMQLAFFIEEIKSKILQPVERLRGTVIHS